MLSGFELYPRWVPLWSGAYLWLFVKTSHEMYFTETSKWLNKTSNFKEFSRLILAIIYGCLSFFTHLSGFRPHQVMPLLSRRLRNLIICHNFCVVLFVVRYSIGHFTHISLKPLDCSADTVILLLSWAVDDDDLLLGLLVPLQSISNLLQSVSSVIIKSDSLFY